MNATATRRRRPAPQPYTVLEWRQTWHIRSGRYYREAVVRRADGALRVFLILDDHRDEVAA